MKLSQPIFPGAFVGSRDADLAQNVVDDQRMKVFPARGVVIDRHGRNAELPGQRPHGEVVETDFAGHPKCRLDDLVRAERRRPSSRARSVLRHGPRSDAGGVVARHGLLASSVISSMPYDNNTHVGV